MRVRLVRMSRYAVVALGSIHSCSSMVGWAWVNPVFRHGVRNPNTSRCTGKACLNQRICLTSGGSRIHDGGTGEVIESS